MDTYLDTIGGLPVHALVVHAVVVLLPLAALGAILMVFWRAFSKRFGPVVVIVAGVAMVAALVAKQAGLELARRVGTPETHAGFGTWMPWVAFAFFLILLVFWLFDRGVPANRRRPLWLAALSWLLLAAAIGAIYWTYRTGDSGSRAVWEPIVENTVRR